MKVVEIDIGLLVPDPDNARAHPPRNIDAIRVSLRRFGQQKPIIIDQDNIIVAGNGVYYAARMEKWKKLEVVQTTLTDAQRRAFAIADNRTNELSEWDATALDASYKILNAAEWDIPEVWFNNKELSKLFVRLDEKERIQEAKEMYDPAALIEKYNVEAGQLWHFVSNDGERVHKLYIGDSTLKRDLSVLFGNNHARLIVTSPPYNQHLDQTDLSGMQHESGYIGRLKAQSYFDSMPETEYQEWQLRALEAWLLIATSDASVMYNHKIRYRDKEVVSPMGWIVQTHWKVRQEIIWRRLGLGTIALNSRMFYPIDERIYWLYCGDDFVFNDSGEIKNYSTIWDIKVTPHALHPASFPIELPTRCIRACSRINDIVFDPYCGSGTTLRAAETLKRIGYGIEQEPRFAAVIIEEMTNLGCTAELVTK